MSPVDREAVEENIRALLRGGDVRGAATAAVRGYGPQILSYLRAVLRDEEAATESFSRFAEGLWKGLPKFRGDASVLTWSYRLAWGAVREVRRDPFRRRARRLATSEAAQLTAEVRESTASYRRTGERSALGRLRESLDPGDQTLLILRIDRKLGWREIAHVLAEGGEDVDEAVLRKRYQRVKARLKRLGEAEGLIGPR